MFKIGLNDEKIRRNKIVIEDTHKNKIEIERESKKRVEEKNSLNKLNTKITNDVVMAFCSSLLNKKLWPCFAPILLTTTTIRYPPHFHCSIVSPYLFYLL